jgi:hypothetical protein
VALQGYVQWAHWPTVGLLHPGGAGVESRVTTKLSYERGSSGKDKDNVFVFDSDADFREFARETACLGNKILHQPLGLLQAQKMAAESMSSGHATGLVNGSKSLPHNSRVVILDETEL